MTASTPSVSGPGRGFVFQLSTGAEPHAAADNRSATPSAKVRAKPSTFNQPVIACMWEAMHVLYIVGKSNLWQGLQSVIRYVPRPIIL